MVELQLLKQKLGESYEEVNEAKEFVEFTQIESIDLAKCSCFVKQKKVGQVEGATLPEYLPSTLES